MNKYLILTVLFLGLMGFGWMYFLTNQVTNYDTAIENCIQKMDSLETRTQILEALVEKLIANPDVRYCPHGRPIYISMSKRELEKQFGRIQ